MWRSKQVVFRHGRLEKMSRDLYSVNPIIRLKVDGECFFANILQFQGADDGLESLNRAEPGLEVYLGAHRLDDGSFWLHWLKIPGRCDLRSRPPDKAVEEAKNKLATWSVLLLISLLICLWLIFGLRTAGGVVTGSVFLVGALCCGVMAWDGLSVLLNSASSVDQTVWRGLEALEAALAEGRPWRTHGLGPADVSPPPEIPRKLAPGLDVVQVGQTYVRQQTVRRTTGRGVVFTEYLIYNFEGDRRMFSWPVINKVQNASAMPAFRRAHPPFLAAGDRVLILALYDHGGLTELIKNLSLPDLEHKPVRELFNITDQTAYRSTIDLKGSLDQLYLLPTVAVPSMTLLGALAGFFTSLGDDLGRAIMNTMELSGLLALSGVLTMGVIVLLMEAFAAFSDSRPDLDAGRENWRRLAAAMKRKTVVPRSFSAAWERFFPRRIWIVSAATVLSALAMALVVMLN